MAFQDREEYVGVWFVFFICAMAMTSIPSNERRHYELENQSKTYYTINLQINLPLMSLNRADLQQ